MNVDSPNLPRKAVDPPRVFISYSYGDVEFARKLAGALRRDRITPWIDEVEMSAGTFLVSRISKAARPVDFIVPVISANSATSGWVQHELKTAMTREFNARRVVVLPARIDGSALPDYLTSERCADFHSAGWSRAYEDLKAAVQGRPGAAPPAQPTPVIRPPLRPARAPDVDDRTPGAKRVYLSFDHDNDGYYRDILITWSQQPDFARFSFIDQPITVPVESEDAEPLKRAIAAKIKAATAFLCVVGAKTSTSPWVEWEIKKADELGKRMIGVRASRDNPVSEALCNSGATWALSFTFEGIKSAMEEAHGS